jgi:2C-methyl-D-erythritol 2,4-cyclodiphosphate synthase
VGRVSLSHDGDGLAGRVDGDVLLHAFCGIAITSGMRAGGWR